MKQSSVFALVVGSVSILVFALAGILFQAQAQSEDTELPAAPAAAVASGPLFSYQGELRNAAGNPITNASLPITFRLFATATGGSACWAESQNVNVQNGQFSVVLGWVIAIPLNCVIGDAYLELVIGNETLLPREPLTSVASAVRADTIKANAQTLGSLTVKGTLNTDGDIYAGGGEVCNVSGTCLTGPNFKLGGEVILHRNDIDRTLHLLPWAGSGWHYDKVCIGCGTGAGLRVNGSTEINGNLNLSGTCARTSLSGNESVAENGNCQAGSLTTGAIVEANLQTPSERASERIKRFNEGDVLCWAGEQLEKCDRANDRLVQAVAGSDGKPIIVGAERIRVLGPVTMGDILVSSSVPGYAMVNNDPLPGTVIGQALEDSDRDAGLIKAMIRKW